MRALLAVARNSFLEAMRQPVMAMALIAMSFLITLLPATSSHLYTFSTGTGLECVAQRMVADLGLATVQLAGLLVSVFVSTTLISLELERKTAATVLVKPLSRAAFILGKYLGVALALILLSAVGVAMTLLTIRAGSGMEHEDPIDGWILIGLFLAGMIGVGRATFLNYSRGRSWIGSFSGSYMAAMLALFSFFAVVDRDHNFIFAPGYEAHSSHEDHGGHESELGTYDWGGRWRRRADDLLGARPRGRRRRRLDPPRRRWQRRNLGNDFYPRSPEQLPSRALHELESPLVGRAAALVPPGLRALLAQRRPGP
jgi:hypothetical protein